MAANTIPVCTLDPNFLAHINMLKEQAKRIYLANTTGNLNPLGLNTTQRLWQVPPNTSVLDPLSISSAYDRTNPNLIYIRALLKGPPLNLGDNAPAGEGRVADCQVEKIQIDYIAAQRRAFGLRHSTSIRCAMHAANRRRGQSTLNDQQFGILDFGAGIPPGATDVTGPVGGVFTTLIRYLYILMQAGYNIPVNLNTPPTAIIQLADSTVVTDTSLPDPIV